MPVADTNETEAVARRAFDAWTTRGTAPATSVLNDMAAFMTLIGRMTESDDPS